MISNLEIKLSCKYDQFCNIVTGILKLISCWRCFKVAIQTMDMILCKCISKKVFSNTFLVHIEIVSIYVFSMNESYTISFLVYLIPNYFQCFSEMSIQK